MLESQQVKDSDPVEQAMLRFRRKGKVYRKITPETPLEDLEVFFESGANGKSPQEFAVVTDEGRKFVLGVVTKADLEDFVRRRPA